MPEQLRDNAQPEPQQNINAPAPNQAVKTEVAPETKGAGLRGLKNSGKGKLENGGQNKATQSVAEQPKTNSKTADTKTANAAEKQKEGEKENNATQSNTNIEQEEANAASADTSVPAVQIAAKSPNFENLKKLLGDKLPTGFRQKVNLTQWQLICPTSIEGANSAQEALNKTVAAMSSHDSSATFNAKIAAYEQIAKEANAAISQINGILPQLAQRPAAQKAVQDFIAALSNLITQAQKQQKELQDAFAEVTEKATDKSILEDEQFMQFLTQKGKDFQIAEPMACLNAHVKGDMKSEEFFYAFIVSKKVIDKRKKEKSLPKADGVELKQGIYKKLWEQYQKNPKKINYDKAIKDIASFVANDAVKTTVKKHIQEQGL
jgi:hypothetical protein